MTTDPAFKRFLYGNYKDPTMEETSDLQPGDVLRVEVYHDDSCALWTGGACNCDPELVTNLVRRGGE